MKAVNLRHLRESKGFSQSYLALKLGKSQSTLSKIENGSIYVTEKIAAQLSEILQVPVATLFSEEPHLIQAVNSNNLANLLFENRKLLVEVQLNQKTILEKLQIVPSGEGAE